MSGLFRMQMNDGVAISFANEYGVVMNDRVAISFANEYGVVISFANE
jgi:hypothetical protein